MPASLYIYTWREGLLSPVGHDLRLSAPHPAIAREGDHWTVRVPAAGIEVDGSMKHGQLYPLSENDRRDIRAALQNDVLNAAERPTIVFRGRLEGANVAGELEIAGQSRRVTLAVKITGSRVRGQVEIVPSQWGIKPYKAMLGALRVADRVGIEFDVNVPELHGAGLREDTIPTVPRRPGSYPT